MEILSTPAGKKKYMKWLFRLADADNKGRVNVEELSMILRALAMDGLAMNELVFDQGWMKTCVMFCFPCIYLLIVCFVCFVLFVCLLLLLLLCVFCFFVFLNFFPGRCRTNHRLYGYCTAHHVRV